MPYDAQTQMLYLPHYELPMHSHANREENDEVHVYQLSEIESSLSQTLADANRHDTIVQGKKLNINYDDVHQKRALSILIDELARACLGERAAETGALVYEINQLIAQAKTGADLTSFSYNAKLILLLLLNFHQSSFIGSASAFIGYLQENGFIAPQKSQEEAEEFRDTYSIDFQQAEGKTQCILRVKNRYGGFVNLTDNMDAVTKNKIQVQKTYCFTLQENGLAQVECLGSELCITDPEGKLLPSLFFD